MSDVNMLTSLKALLFSSAAPSTSAVVAAQPAGEGMDFAALIGAAGEPTDLALPLPLPPAVGGDAVKNAPAPEVATLPLGTAQLLDARQARPPLPLTAVPPEGVAEIAPATAIEAPAEVPAEQAVAVPAMPIAMAPAEEPVPAQGKAPPPSKLKGVAQPVPAQTEAVEARDEPETQEKAEEGEAVTADVDPAPPQVAVVMPALPPVVAPPVTVVPQDRSASETPRAKAEQPVGAPSLSSSPPVVEAAAAPAAPLDARPAPAAAVAPVALPDAPQPSSAVRPADAPEQPAPMAAVSAGGVQPVIEAPADQPMPAVDATSIAAPADKARPKPVKSEALSLLQLVREQFAPRSSAAPSAAPMASHGKADRPIETGEAAPAPVPATDQPNAPSPPAAAQPAPSGPQPAPQPVADLSASLGAQVVDMGVSGQWIDGLARDIAGLSANGAQGRFQINTDQLGPVQVDIRHGNEGAAISLTVASEAAETALRQDSDRLRLDAGLSAVRIAEVKIERAPHVAEAARADGASQQGSQQQQQSSQQPQTANGWANGNQSMAQSQGQGQGRWRPQDNGAFSPKNSGDPAVLNHDDMRRAGNDAAQARYA